MSEEKPPTRETENDGQQTEGPMEITVDPTRLQELVEELRFEQNWVAGITAGAVVAVSSAVVWALVTVSTGYQIGWMAIGVGFVVGYAVRIVGKGIDPAFGIIGAVMALLGCALGNVFAASAIVASESSVSVFEVVAALDWQMAGELLVAWFSPMDVLFYGIAVYEGYRFSFRQLSQEELLRVAE